MLKIKTLFTLTLLHLFHLVGYGNGGGYAHGTDFTGGIAPFTASGTENVQILDEKLDITLGNDSAKVNVLYQMKNKTDKAVSVTFGFPVEDVINQWQDEVKKKNAEPAYTKNYRVLLNGKAVKHAYQAEPFAAGKVKPFAGSDALKGIKGWLVSTINLKKGETISLQISYHSDYSLYSEFVSEDSVISPQLFKYRLSSGAIWNGPIKKGKVTISYTDLNPAELRIEKPVNRFKKTGKSYVWEFTDLEPTLADDISVKVEDGYSTYSYSGNDKDIFYYVSKGDSWYILRAGYKATASSTLPKQGENEYIADNLLDDWSRVWSEGVKGDGIGESLTLNLTKPQKVNALTIRNGYTATEKKKKHLYKANNRVKSVEVLINGKHKETIVLYDKNSSKIYPLKYDKKISTIKLTINSVYKGNKYQDTCLTSIHLLEKLTKKPKQYGAR